MFKGKTFDDDGKERTDGKGFFSNEISRWWKKEGAGVDFVRTLFPNISISLGLGIGQIDQI